MPPECVVGKLWWLTHVLLVLSVVSITLGRESEERYRRPAYDEVGSADSLTGMWHRVNVEDLGILVENWLVCTDPNCP